MSKRLNGLCHVVIVFLVGLCLYSQAQGDPEGSLVTTLSKEQIKEFSTLVFNRDLRRQELAVTLRIGAEKQRELKGFMDEMAKEFGIKPEYSYSYQIEEKQLYQLVTNKLDKAGNPEKKKVRKVKSDSESQYLSRLLVARKLTENQIHVLAQLRAEKQKEAQLLDEKLRTTFKLEPTAGYRLEEASGKVFRLPPPEKSKDGKPVVEPSAKPNSGTPKSQSK